MKYHLPVLTERAVREAEATKRLVADDFEAKVRTALVDGKRAVTCHKGCHHCCHFPVMVSVLEGISLFRWLSDRGLWRKDLKEAFEQGHKRVWGLDPTVWMLSMTPCPLLSDGLCTAYEARPFVCRTTVSINDPYFCHPHRFSEGLAMLMDRREAAGTLQKVEDRLLHSLHMTKLRLPLSTAVLLGERFCKEGLEPQEANGHLFEEWLRNC